MIRKLDLKFIPLILTSLVVLKIRSCVCQDQQYQTCSQRFRCGRFGEVSYPFYGGTRPAFCGYPGFELNCGGDDPLINIASIDYRVLAIDNSPQTLRVSRNDLWDNLCPRSLLNTTIDLNLFNFYTPANDQNLTLYYGCTFSSQQPAQPPYEFICTASNQNRSNFVTIREASGQSYLNATCNSQVYVVVNQTEGQNLALNPLNSTARLQTALQGGFTIQWSADNENCPDCVLSGGLCGSNQSSFACHCATGTYESTCNGTGSKGLSDMHKYVIIGASLGIVGLVISSIVIYYMTRQHRLRDQGPESDQNVDKFLLNHGSLAPKRFSYNEIKKITKSFTHKLGQGGYGIVYKGNLADGHPVAVKVLTETHDNAEEFINEVASISRTSHVNIVNLLGFCYERKKRALVYEFMPNKSLDKFIYKSGSVDPECTLEWENLYKIAVGVARGLEYLHRGCNTRIVHFDIKPQNILLGEDFCPKISDFGLAKLFKEKQSIISMLGTRGTIGYIAPEVFSRNFGVVSHKSDVYSYGMMLLEMAEVRKVTETGVTRLSDNYISDKIYEQVLLKNEESGDPVIEEKEETKRKMLLVGLWCIQTAPSDRPSMTKVVEMLEGSVQSIQIPPKPFLFSPQRPERQFSSSSSSSVNIEIGNPTEG